MVTRKLRNIKRMVIKIGTAIITSNNKLNKKWLIGKIKEIAELQKSGMEIIVVTSGAVGTGMQSEGIRIRPKEPLRLQLLSGKGQAILMGIYERGFRRYGIHTSQVLLTHHNFSSKQEVENIRVVVDEYLMESTIPIINTNDVITSEELMSNSTGKFSDNDELAGLVAINLNVDILLILTDVDGLYTKDPSKDRDAIFIPEVKRITDDIMGMASKDGNSMGRGGMHSKVIAAKDVGKHGIITIVANGKYNIPKILIGDVKRTIFG
ncbi:MAG: glutamate 5-kinase [Nanoarchaeota archaeon]